MGTHFNYIWVKSYQFYSWKHNICMPSTFPVYCWGWRNVSVNQAVTFVLMEHWESFQHSMWCIHIWNRNDVGRSVRINRATTGCHKKVMPYLSHERNILCTHKGIISFSFYHFIMRQYLFILLLRDTFEGWQQYKSVPRGIVVYDHVMCVFLFMYDYYIEHLRVWQTQTYRVPFTNCYQLMLAQLPGQVQITTVVNLAHCALMTAYGDRYLGQHWFR